LECYDGRLSGTVVGSGRGILAETLKPKKSKD